MDFNALERPLWRSIYFNKLKLLEANTQIFVYNDKFSYFVRLKTTHTCPRRSARIKAFTWFLTTAPFQIAVVLELDQHSYLNGGVIGKNRYRASIRGLSMNWFR